MGLGGVLGWASLTGGAEEHWREEKRRRARGGLVEEERGTRVLPVRCGNREEGLKRVRGEEEKSPACMYGVGAVQGRGDEKRGGQGWGPGLGEKMGEEMDLSLVALMRYSRS